MRKEGPQKFFAGLFPLSRILLPAVAVVALCSLLVWSPCCRRDRGSGRHSSTSRPCLTCWRRRCRGPASGGGCWSGTCWGSGSCPWTGSTGTTGTSWSARTMAGLHRLDSIRRIPTASVSTRRRAIEVLHLPRQSRRRARRWRLGATQRKSAEVTPRERCLVTDSLVRHQLVLTRAGKRCTGWVDVNTGDAQHMLDDFLMKPEVTDSRTPCSSQCIYAQQVQASLIMC